MTVNFSALEKLIDTMPERGIPLCDLSVTKDGETVFRRSSGFSDAAKTKPVSRDDLYWIFSASKVTTCVAALRLLEEGKIRLDDPVSKYIPAFAHLTVKNADGSVVPCKTEMTVLHLFTMSGGLGSNLASPAITAAVRQNPSASTLEIASAMANDPLGFEPGTHFRYGLCHDVLAAVVEVASGMRFSEYLRTQIFEPLGMVNTGFRPNEEQIARFSATYNYDASLGTSTLTKTENPYALTPDYDSGGAGLFSCVDDYTRLATTLAMGGTSAEGYHLLSPETIALAEVNRLSPTALRDFVPDHPGYGWGLCGRVHRDPVYSLSRAPVGEFGWYGAAAALVTVNRADRIGIYLGTQVHYCGYLCNMIHPILRNLVYEGLEG